MSPFRHRRVSHLLRAEVGRAKRRLSMINQMRLPRGNRRSVVPRIEPCQPGGLPDAMHAGADSLFAQQWYRISTGRKIKKKKWGKSFRVPHAD